MARQGARGPAVAAVVAALAAVGGLVCGMVGLVHAPAVADAVVLAAGAVVGLPAAVLGLLVVRRRPGNVVGALLVAVGAVPCLIFGREVYSAAAGSIAGSARLDGPRLAGAGRVDVVVRARRAARAVLPGRPAAAAARRWLAWG